MPALLEAAKAVSPGITRAALKRALGPGPFYSLEDIVLASSKRASQVCLPHPCCLSKPACTHACTPA